MRVDDDRVKILADIYINTELTIREFAPIVGLSKSCLFSAFTRRLKRIDYGQWINYCIVAGRKKYLGTIKGGKISRIRSKKKNG